MPTLPLVITSGRYSLPHAGSGSAVAFGKLDLQWISLSVFGGKYRRKRFAVAFDLIDELQRNVMMMNVDGGCRGAARRRRVAHPANRRTRLRVFA